MPSIGDGTLWIGDECVGSVSGISISSKPLRSGDLPDGHAGSVTHEPPEPFSVTFDMTDCTYYTNEQSAQHQRINRIVAMANKVLGRKGFVGHVPQDNAVHDACDDHTSLITVLSDDDPLRCVAWAARQLYAVIKGKSGPVHAAWFTYTLHKTKAGAYDGGLLVLTTLSAKPGVSANFRF